MSSRSHRYINTFAPSVYASGYDRDTLVPRGYGDPVADEEKGGVGDQIAQYIPAIKSFLGVDDPRDQLPALQAKLDVLNAGGAQAVAMAISVGTLGNVSAAISKVRNQMAAIEAQAAQVRTRDRLYTGLALTGVAIGVSLTAYIGFRAYGAYREAKDS